MGVVDFYNAAKKAGIKPILGYEAYVAADLHEKTSKDREYAHLLLLAKTQQGYQNLMQLCSIGFLKGYYYKPRIDYDTLEKYSEGLICSSACIGGDLPQMLLQGRMEDARALAVRLKGMFGRDFYIEIQDHGLPGGAARQPTAHRAGAGIGHSAYRDQRQPLCGKGGRPGRRTF